MLATQTSPLPALHDHHWSLAMSAAGSSSQQRPKASGSSTTAAAAPTSVFNALGSYADRIRESSGSSTTRNVKTSPHPASAALSPEGSRQAATPVSSGAASPVSANPSKNALPNGHSATTSNSSRPVNTSTPPSKPTEPAEEGEWETVSTRVKTRTERGPNREREREPKEEASRASASRNWRKDKVDDEKERLASGPSKQAKPAPTVSASAPVSTVPSPSRSAAPSASSGSTLPAKSVWGMEANAAVRTTPSTPVTTTLHTPKPTTQSQVHALVQAHLDHPPVPSLSSPDGTAATVTSASVPPSVASPDLSAETESTAPTSIALNRNGESEDEGSWRAKPKKPEDVAPSAPVAPKQPAPPPAVNPWDLRKKKLAPAAEVVSSLVSAPQVAAPAAAVKGKLSVSTKVEAHERAPKSAGPVLQFGAFDAPVPNGTASDPAAEIKAKKTGGKKKTAPTPSETVPPPSLADPSAWPDVAKAVEESAKAVVEKKAKKEKESEASSVSEEPVLGGKKQKWTPIPAAELQEAADKAAESNRRQKAAANKRATSRETGSEASTRGRKPMPVGARGPRQARAGSADEIRLPPQPDGGRAVNGFNFGNVGAGAIEPSEAAGLVADRPIAQVGDAANEVPAATPSTMGDMSTATSVVSSTNNQASVTAPTSASAPLSRQTSKQDLHRTPPRPHSGPSASASASGSVSGEKREPLEASYGRHYTAPIPQHGFNASATVPRPPRGRVDRDGVPTRGGYTGRGRGGYRSSSAMPAGGKMFYPHHHANHATMGGDNEYGNVYQRGYGMGYPPATTANGSVSTGTSPVSGAHATMYGGGFYPVNNGYVPAMTMYDPSTQGMGMGMGMYPRAGPAPPLPITAVPNLDPLRSYVLGQVEYYFSMQNLAMDVFLRQQMDTEGWIDISMIVSFNRVKNLTTDVALVREVMGLSSLLEVREDSVRLANGDAKQYVLPGAKPPKFPASDDAGSASASASASVSASSYPNVLGQQRQASYSSIATDETDPLGGGSALGLAVPSAEAVAYEMFPSASAPGAVVGATSPRRINPGDVESALMKSSSSAAARAAGVGQAGSGGLSGQTVFGGPGLSPRPLPGSVSALGVGVGIASDLEGGKEVLTETPDTSVAEDNEDSGEKGEAQGQGQGQREQDEEAQAAGAGAGLGMTGVGARQ